MVRRPTGLTRQVSILSLIHIFWYATLYGKLSQSANFVTAAAKTYEAARDLYGQGSLEQQAVKAGWAEVGIDVESSTPPDPGTRPGCATTLTTLARSLFGPRR